MVSPRVPAENSALNTRERHVIGNKTDDTATAVSDAQSLVAYGKGALAKALLIGTPANTGGTATLAGIMGDPSNTSFATSLAKLGTLTNTGGTATLGAILGDFANATLISILNSMERTIAKTDGAVLSGDDNLFTVAGGPIMITRFVGRVTTIIGGAANMTIQEAVTDPAGDVAFSTTVAIDDDAAGTTYTFTAASPSVLTPTTAGALVNVPTVNWLAVPGTIQALGSAAQSGVIAWYMSYIPLSPSAVVTAAA